MTFDYTLISDGYSSEFLKSRVDHELDVIAQTGKGKLTTFNDRWISMYRGLEFKGYTRTQSSLRKVDDIGVFKETGSMIFSEGVEFINSPTNCGVTCIPTRMMREPENSWWKLCMNSCLAIVEVDVDAFLPLYYKNTGMVLDIWRHGSVAGFITAVKPGVEMVIGGLSRDKEYMVVRNVIDMDNPDCTVAHARRDAQAENKYRRMKRKNEIYPIMPMRSGCAPSTIVLCSRELPEATELVHNALMNYPSLNTYGKSIKGYTGDTDKITLSDNSKKWNTKDIHIVRLPNLKKYGKDEYRERLRIFYSDEISWRIPVPIRCLTLLQGDNVMLPMEFRKEFGIRYMNRILNNSRVEPFITNKY